MVHAIPPSAAKKTAMSKKHLFFWTLLAGSQAHGESSSVAANLARRVESENAYLANRHPECLHDCIFLICDTCGETVHVDDDALSASIRKAAASAGFSAPRPVIEVRGTCGKCDPD